MKLSIPSAILMMALSGCSAASVPLAATQAAPAKAVQCNNYQSKDRGVMSAGRNILCTYGGGAAINDLTSLGDGSGVVDVKVDLGGNAIIEIQRPSPTSYSTVTMTYTNHPTVITDTVDMRETQGGKVSCGVLCGWIVGHIIDWAITHDVWGQPLGQVVPAVPNSSAPNGGQWVPTPIRIGPGGLPPGWVPANQNTGNPDIPPSVPPPPGGGCMVDYIGWDCRNYQ